VDDKDIKKYDMCVKVDDEGAKRKRTPRGWTMGALKAMNGKHMFPSPHRIFVLFHTSSLFNIFFDVPTFALLFK
jgi:hypothetical protein